MAMMMSYWGRNLMSFGVDGRITVTPLRFLGDALTAAMTADTTCRLAVMAKDVMIFVPELTDCEKAERIMRVEVFLPDPDASKN